MFILHINTNHWFKAKNLAIVVANQIQPNKQLHVVYHFVAGVAPELAIMNAVVETTVDKVSRIYTICYNIFNIIIDHSSQRSKLFQAFGKLSSSNEADARYIWGM